MKSTRTPQLYRVLVPAKNLDRSRRFYESLFSIRGRKVGGGRIYIDCGRVILGILDYSRQTGAELPNPTEALYFATGALERIYLRARRLGCLSRELLHGDPSSPLGQIVVRPWGERSFYVEDPAGNTLCFVDRKTLFTGTRHQVAVLARRSRTTSARPKGRAGKTKRH
jgi:catechol 2,3-dioxygenase-like lactoylglutathione lyase family enzyme